MARRSATSTLALCTHTLWKAASRTQPGVGTFRHLGVGMAPTESLPGMRASVGGPQPRLGPLRIEHGCPDPHLGPCTRGTGEHVQTWIHR